MLGCPVGIEKRAADIDDRLSVPVHDEALLVRHDRHGHGRRVLLARDIQELLHIFPADNDSHALLALADRQLGSVESVVFLRDRVQVNLQSVCELSDCDGDAARAEVVAALDHAARVAPSEEPLKLSLRRGISLLDLRPAGLERLDCMGLGRSGRTADSVAPGRSAEQDHDIARRRPLPADIFRRGRGDHRSDLHALGDITRVIQFIDDAGRQTDLVAVGRVACCRLCHDRALRKLAWDRLADRL